MASNGTDLLEWQQRQLHGIRWWAQRTRRRRHLRALAYAAAGAGGYAVTVGMTYAYLR